MNNLSITARDIFINFRIISGRMMPLRAKLLGKKGRFIDRNNIEFYLVQRGVKLNGALMSNCRGGLLICKEAGNFFSNQLGWGQTIHF